MPSHPVVTPITKLVGKPQEQGRIRPGKKNEKGWPVALKTFRFTSADKNAIIKIAEIYGGTVAPWDDPKATVRNQFEVITDASEIDVWVPPDSVFHGYEKWAGGGCERRCDGETVTLPEQEAELPCLCVVNNKLECKPKTRISVVLPDVDFGGTWRLDSNSWDTHREMPSMASLLGGMAENQAFIMAKLSLVQRSKLKKMKGKMQKVNYVVPTLSAAMSPRAMMAGQQSEVPTSLAGVRDAPELVAGDDQIIEGEIIDVVEEPNTDAVGILYTYSTKAEAIKAGHKDADIKKIKAGVWEVWA
jgi:hypothetical protein